MIFHENSMKTGTFPLICLTDNIAKKKSFFLGAMDFYCGFM